MTSIYQHTEENPFHISVGAVLVNEKGEVCAHAFPVRGLPEDVRNAVSVEELYILMRESLEDGETLEEAVLRGIREEFGAEGSVVRYLGSLRGRAFSSKGMFQKTTLYFLVRLAGLGERVPGDWESSSRMVWMDPKILIQRMREQKSDLRDDMDESEIIESYLAHT